MAALQVFGKRIITHLLPQISEHEFYLLRNLKLKVNRNKPCTIETHEHDISYIRARCDPTFSCICEH